MVAAYIPHRTKIWICKERILLLQATRMLELQDVEQQQQFCFVFSKLTFLWSSFMPAQVGSMSCLMHFFSCQEHEYYQHLRKPVVLSHSWPESLSLEVAQRSIPRNNWDWSISASFPFLPKGQAEMGILSRSGVWQLLPILGAGVNNRDPSVGWWDLGSAAKHLGWISILVLE